MVKIKSSKCGFAGMHHCRYAGFLRNVVSRAIHAMSIQCVCLVGLYLAFGCNTLFALEILRDNRILISRENATHIEGFRIRQEKLKVGSILVSRPVQVDRDIANVLQSNGIRCLEDYEKWLSRATTYRKDHAQDVWSQPLDTAVKRYGDCEDYALLNASALRVLGYEPRVLAMARLGNGHAICVFEKNGRFLWFDNNKLKITDTLSLEEFARYIFKNYRCTCVLELETDEKRWKILFQKSKLL